MRRTTPALALALAAVALTALIAISIRAPLAQQAAPAGNAKGGAATPGPFPGAKNAGTLLQEDETGVGTEGREVTASTILWRLGQTTGWHTHPGDEIGYVLEGELTWEVAGAAPKIIHPGEAYHNQAGVVHRTSNLGTVPTLSYSVYITEKGKPRSTNAPAPPG